jgi:hypothetical protein
MRFNIKHAGELDAMSKMIAAFQYHGVRFTTTVVDANFIVVEILTVA